MKDLFFACALGAIIAATATAKADSVRLTGADMSWSHPHYVERMNEIWRFVLGDLARLDDREIVPPEVHLEPFVRAQQSSQWTEWQNDWIANHADVWLEWTDIKGVDRAQITPDWVRAHLADLYPFPVTFRGFHYDGTDKVQVNPQTTFLAFYQNDPQGIKKDFVGYGYYVSGHEMTHYALAQRGIPDRLHHCIYVVSVDQKPSLMQRLADALIERGFASSMVKRAGYDQEVYLDPCAQLKEGERDDAMKYAFQLAHGL